MFRRWAASGLIAMMAAAGGGTGAGAGAAADALDWSALPLPGIDGAPVPPETLRGKVVLVVNTASFCGFTRQYKGLETLWTRYRDGGFVVLGVPSNDFGAQEPGSNGTIKEFCETTYGIDFPMLEKQTVRGDGAHPLFRWIVEQAGAAARPQWNFHKYLVGRDGHLAGWYPSSVEPDDASLTQAVERALAAPGSAPSPS